MKRLSRANARLAALYGVGYLALFGLHATICRMPKGVPGSWMVALTTAASPSGSLDFWQSPAWPALDIKPLDGVVGRIFCNPNAGGMALELAAQDSDNSTDLNG